jgi:DNA polymerase II small subunit/DNA polymerase delta subunit B
MIELLKELKKKVLIEKKALEFLEKNFQLLPKVLEFVNVQKISFLTYQKLQEFFLTKPEIEIKFIKRLEKKEKVSVLDYHSIRIKRYEYFQKILRSRIELVNLISINKITSKTKIFSLIGMINKINDDSIVLEDLTGQIEVKLLKKEFLVEDEVIGVVCNKNDEIVVKKIIFPDLPFQKNIKKTEEPYFFHFLTQEFLETYENKFENWLKDYPNSWVFLLGNNDKYYDFSKLGNPAYFSFFDFVILLSSSEFLDKYGGAKEEILRNLLKKRHLNPKLNKELNDFYLLDPIPDLIVLKAERTSFFNYKGISLLLCGPESFLSFNTKSREILKTSFG